MFNQKFTAAVLALVASATALGISAGPAQAESVSVHTSNVQLATASGRSSVDARLVKAAERVCRADEALPLSDYAARRNCATAALANARARVAQISTGMQVATR